MKKDDIRTINALRALFPSELKVSVMRSENGNFVAHIDTFKGLFTEGSNFSELIEMVNDAVKTYFEVPSKFLSYMPNYIPPLRVAQRLDIFPATEASETVVFPISSGEKTAC
jgi:predicted RNase H-like HicB family nuclease